MSELEAKRPTIDVAAPPTDARPEVRMKSWMTWILRLGGVVLLALVLFYVGRELRKNLLALRGRPIDGRWGYVAAGLAVLLGARLMNALNCRVLLSALGTVVPTRRVIPVIWISSLGRYMRGKVAVVAGSVGWLMKLGVRMPVAVTALFLSTALMILIGLVTATPLVFLSADIQGQLPFARTIAVAMLLVGLICLYPPIFLTICNAALLRLKRAPLPRQMRPGAFWGAIGLTATRSAPLGEV